MIQIHDKNLDNQNSISANFLYFFDSDKSSTSQSSSVRPIKVCLSLNEKMMIWYLSDKGCFNDWLSRHFHNGRDPLCGVPRGDG